MESLIYIAKVNLFWILFYGSYWLLFRKHTFFVWNRFYLTGTLLLSSILPLVEFPETELPPSARVVPGIVYEISAAPVVLTSGPAATPETDWSQLVWILYFTGSCLMLLRLIYGFYQVRRLIRQGECLKFDDYSIILLPEGESAMNKTGSFSFFRWMVISDYDYKNHLDTILRHEYIHIRQWHSIDIILIEFLKAGFWFNPALWLYKRSMQEVHEFLADEQIANREHYAKFLVSYAFNAPVQSVTNHFFNSSLLKNRIKMIYKNRTSRWLLSKYLMLIPMTALVIITTAARKKSIALFPDKNVSSSNLFKDNTLPLSNPLELLYPENHDGEKISIKGQVTDEKGTAVPDAIVVVKNGSQGTVTNVSGEFELKDVPVESEIVVSHVGFINSGFVVEKSRTNYKVKLQKSENRLSEVVVVGYPSSDSKKSIPDTSGTAFKVVEQNPEFPGGDVELMKYIGKHIRYPAEASVAGVEGTVLISFTVNPNGDIRKPTIVKGLGYGIDDEATRMVLNMPRWTPARQNGKALSVDYTLPIKFQLNHGDINNIKEKQQGYFQKPEMPDGVRINDLGGGSKVDNVLFIVDGVKMKERGLTGLPKLNPDEIESIAVLKDQSALAVYGEEGKNGVILVRTKKIKETTKPAQQKTPATGGKFYNYKYPFDNNSSQDLSEKTVLGYRIPSEKNPKN
ncbi:hypothetical protein DYBT9275_04196 [Dyadobacter sp. CECT 9275]|uniref:TonB C-terminal domain-containing protein n=1 Tax=Dyadobacter helix TaxID=2822344 RepID=A0A916JIU5_9BACT|nr:M56 family metallopeptidase [Dyadobacter sp. CECT 9275]CAG5008116.1 hypothetical protein DYBT9275_04196 [Dyadobacter sp. CECT 9275]